MCKFFTRLKTAARVAAVVLSAAAVASSIHAASNSIGNLDDPRIAGAYTAPEEGGVGSSVIDPSTYVSPYYGASLYGGTSSENFAAPSGVLPYRMKRLGKFYLDGWVSAGGTTNNEWPLTYSPSAGGDTSINDPTSKAGMNQLYVVMGREMTKGGSVDYGIRADVLYGTDYMRSSALGLETRDYRSSPFGDFPVSTPYRADTRWNRNSAGGYPEYGISMPQLYAEFYAPILAGTTVKMGHFYSPIGYESIPSPSNFFYSHSYSMLYAEADTVTGLLGEASLNPNFSLLAGFDQGWDSWTDNNDAKDILGGAKWQSFDRNTSLTFMLSTGKQILDHETQYFRTTNRIETFNANVTNYSLVFQKKLCPNLTYVLQHDLGISEDGGYEYYNDQKKIYDARWYSVVNYVYWQLDPSLTLGFRAEWFKDESYSRIYGGPSSNLISYRDPTGQAKMYGYKWEGDNFIDLSLGLNWKPAEWLTVRPEVRWDYSDMKCVGYGGYEGSNGVFDHLSKDNLVTVGGDVVVRF